MTRHFSIELIDPDNGTQRLEVSEKETIWDAADRKGIRLPYTCLQGWCLTCAGRVLEGEYDQSLSLRFFPADKKAGFILLCTARPRSNLRILTNQKTSMQQYRHETGLPAPRG